MSAYTNFISRRSVYFGVTACLVFASALVACGGGGSSSASSSASTSVASSSGTITAFGSVFVNGHEFGTGRARFFDDDNGTTLTARDLEVGMVVDVTPGSGSSTSEASELHIHPLVRGYTDAFDTTASTVTVMGQTVQVTASTNFSDHRACATASPATCTAITGLSGLTASTSGTPGVGGTYITVHGYLFSGSSGSTNVVATLISAADQPASTSNKFNFKVEGPVSATGLAPTIGGLTLDLTSTTCRVSGTVTPCATAYTAAQVVSVGSATAPGTLPAASFAPSVARLASKLPVQTSGQTLELEGVVSSVGTTTFVVRGVTVDATGLPSGTSLPAVGDLVEVMGSISSSGQTVNATTLKTIRAAATVSLGLQGDASNVTTVSAGATYTFSLLGQTVNVNAQTRLVDMSIRHWDDRDQSVNPFNISTFATYLGASTSKHVVVRSEADSTGKLTALSVAIVPASTVASVSGVIDASPAVSNSSVSGTPTTFSIHGVAVSADPASIYKPHTASMQTVAAGDLVTAMGTFSGGVLSVSATTSRTNYAMDVGVPVVNTRDRLDF